MTDTIALRIALLAMILVAAAWLGWRAGLLSLGPSETQVIERLADRYVAETGGARTDCVGVPAVEAWIRVTCGEDWSLAVDRSGAIVGAGSEPAEGQGNG